VFKISAIALSNGTSVLHVVCSESKILKPLIVLYGLETKEVK
jgi:hypothetical protein